MFVEDVGRHNAVDAIAGRMWLDRLDGGDKIFYTTGPPHLRDGDQGRADGHPVPRVALGPHADGLRDRAEGRPHDDRPRDEQALPAVHRRASGSVRHERPEQRRRDGAAHGAATAGACAFVADISVALRRALPLRELPARARRRVRHLGGLSVGAGARSRTAPTTSRRTNRRRRRTAGSAAAAAPSSSSSRRKWPGETHVVLAAFDEPVDRAPTGTRSTRSTSSWLPALTDAAHDDRRRDVTGIVLAGGMGRRMGGVDKGLVAARRPADGRARARAARAAGRRAA